MHGKTLPRSSRAVPSLPLKALAGSAVVAAAVLAGAPGALAAPTSSASTTGSPSSSAPKATACDTDAHWPRYVQGKPDGFDAHDDGVYVWHNPKGGWAIRVTHPVLPGKANQVVFTATITTAGQIGHVVRVRDEKNDVVKVTNNGHTLTFRFVNYGWVDGVDFTSGCTPGLRVDLKADGSSMPTRFIHLGDKKVNPGSDPFLIRRHDNDPTTVAPPAAGTTTGTPTPAPSAGTGTGTGSGAPAGVTSAA
jgi:hypothetical protein